MHRPRLLGWHSCNAYHVISRTAGQDFLLGAGEREVFGLMLEKVAKFCGVELLTWCCLSNHFHLLVRIDDERCAALRTRLRNDPVAFREHLLKLYRPAAVREIEKELASLVEAGSRRAARALIESYLLRIGDLSVFVKELKQRFSIWYNHHHDRSGTLWDARFRSVLVENSTSALRTVACYIDLNPVRAGIVTDPKDYRWCGYSQALGGNRTARSGLLAVLRSPSEGQPPGTVPSRDYVRAAEDYRLLLFGKAVALESEKSGQAGATLRKGADPNAVAKVVKNGGRLSAGERFLLRVRHISAGTALGSKEFLADLLVEKPEQAGPRRKYPACSVPGLEVDDFHSFRDPC